MTPVEFMKTLMNNLKIQDFGDTSFDTAIEQTTKSRYKSWASLIAEIESQISKITTEKEAKDFLLSKCGINLENEDTGSLLGFDTSGGQVADDFAVIKESGTLKHLTEKTFDYGGITFSVPDNLSEKESRLVDILYTWCLPLGVKKVEQSYGLTVTDSSLINVMPIDFFSEAYNPSSGTTLAYVETYFTNNVLSQFFLRVNSHDTVYGDAEDGDDGLNGSQDNLLDETLAHEFTHALMATNIKIYHSLPRWFKEGTAELVIGADVSRKQDILSVAASVSAFHQGITDDTSLGLNKYAVGYIVLRYLLKQVAIPADDDYEMPSNCVYTLKELTERIKSFLTSSYNGTIPWEYVDNPTNQMLTDINTTNTGYHPFGMTFKIPNGNNPAYLTINWESIQLGQYKRLTESFPDYFFPTVWERVKMCQYGLDDWGDAVYTTTPYVWERNEIFKEGGEYLFFNLHLKQEMGLYSYEQGGSSTENESYTDIVPTGSYNLIPLHDTIISPCLQTDVFREPKRFPGMGSAILAIANKNKGDADFRCIEYWMTKTDRSATVTIRINKKYYQSITFGFLEHVDERFYPYPLYIGGGTQALAPSTYTYIAVNGKCQQHKYGNVFSSDIKNKSFVNGNILNTCKFNGASCTNFRVRRPSGIWDNYNNFKQSASRTNLYECPRCGGYGQCYEPQFIYDITPPSKDDTSTARIYPRDIGFNFHEVRTTAVDDTLKYTYINKLDQMQLIPTDVYTTDLTPPIKQKMDISTVLFPILPYLIHHAEYYAIKDSASANGIMGQVPNQYAIWDKSGRHGVNKLGDKGYLLVPAGYAERLIAYPSMNGVVNWFPREEEITTWYNNIYNDNNTIYSTLAIDLSVTITYEFLLDYVILNANNGKSFSLYKNRLYYMNRSTDVKKFYFVHDNIEETLELKLLDGGQMSARFRLRADTYPYFDMTGISMSKEEAKSTMHTISIEEKTDLGMGLDNISITEGDGMNIPQHFDNPALKVVI